VRGVQAHFSTLISQIASDQIDRDRIEDWTPMMIVTRKNVNCASMNILSPSGRSHTSIKTENGNFMWFQLLIEVFLRMKYSTSDRKGLVAIWKRIYTGNEAEHVKIGEFEQTYEPSKALWWYTRDCCIYRLLNKALRLQDIDMLFHFRFIITDIYKQLQQAQQNKKYNVIVRTYRGQAMPKEELKRMSESIGEFISMNSFLSTSRNREIARGFAASVVDCKDFEAVLFEIEANTSIVSKPFADIIEN
ncbi:unnamed protein product, partial [Didymodactylos carnosus]